MKNYFRFMAGNAGRVLKGIIGFALIGWGYNTPSYPLNVILGIVGLLLLLSAFLNVLLLAPLFGLSASGKKITGKYGSLEGIPGEDPTARPQKHGIPVHDSDKDSHRMSGDRQGTIKLAGHDNETDDLSDVRLVDHKQ